MKTETSLQMDWSLVQRRTYNDTFEGGEYERDMPENPGNRELFSGEDDRQSLIVKKENFFQTEHQKELYRQIENVVCAL